MKANVVSVRVSLGDLNVKGEAPIATTETHKKHGNAYCSKKIKKGVFSRFCHVLSYF